jgi:hypothetical protein
VRSCKIRDAIILLLICPPSVGRSQVSRQDGETGTVQTKSDSTLAGVVVVGVAVVDAVVVVVVVVVVAAAAAVVVGVVSSVVIVVVVGVVWC